MNDEYNIEINIVSRETRKHVTVALAGDGADELFAGYRKYKGEFWIKYYSMLPQTIRDKAIQRLFHNLPDSRNNPLSERIRRIKKFLNGAHDSLKERICAWREVFSEDARRLILEPEVLMRMSNNIPKEIVDENNQNLPNGEVGEDYYNCLGSR